MSNKPAYDANELRKQLKFITRNGPLRTVITDTESITGVALECGPHDHPEDRPHHVEECCDEDVIEMWHEKHAAFFVAATTAIPALLDRVAELEARPDEQPQDAQPERDGDGDVRAVTRAWLYGTNEHHSEHAYTTIEAAQADAIWEYDPTLAEYPEYWSWEPCPPQDGRLAMLCGDDRTGYTVYPVTVVAQSTAALDARDAKGGE